MSSAFSETRLAITLTLLCSIQRKKNNVFPSVSINVECKGTELDRSAKTQKVAIVLNFLIFTHQMY